MTVVNHCAGSNARWLALTPGDTKTIISVFFYYDGKTSKTLNMSDFIIYFNLFGEFDNFDDWDPTTASGAQLSVVSDAGLGCQYRKDENGATFCHLPTSQPVVRVLASHKL